MRLLHFLIIPFILASSLMSTGQSIHHWEAVVYDSMVWRYWSGTTDPGITWNSTTFNDQGWQQGRGSIGYGDGDDRTTISPVISVFMRKKFTIADRFKIKQAFLHADYDDGFIAYLNGVEIARSFMNAGNIPYNQGSAGFHEALLYQGQSPERFLIDEAKVSSLLVNGINTLAIEVHNESIGSSDLSSAFFLTVGIADNTFTYLPTPTWFVQPFSFTSSNLPIIKITTNGQTIPDVTRIVATMGIIDNGVGVVNNVGDPFNNYDGKITIETRGESSQYIFPKKSFGLETQDDFGKNRNVALLGMPAENDWILYAPYTDKTMMRDVLAYQLGRALGNYAPRTKFVELMIEGEYMGVYVLMEKIKRDKNRVDIAALKPIDITGDALTGGYILRVDKLDPTDFPGWQATPTIQLPNENDITFQYYNPDGADLLPVQRSYIQNYIQSFQSSLTSSIYQDTQLGYKSKIDVPSFVNFMLVNEIGKNIDGYVFSTYLYKAKDSDGGLLYMGPLWDFNLAFGNVDYLANAQFAPGWMWDDQYRMFWFRRMIQDPMFKASLKCRWQTLRNGFLTNQFFTNKIDSMALTLQAAQSRNYQRWPILGQYVWPNQYVGQTYQDELNFLKQWIIARLAWMDSNMPGDCSLITAVEELKTIDLNVFPNPFKVSVKILFPTDYNGHILSVIDLTGREVFNVTISANELEWQGIDQQGRPLPKGLYLIRVSNKEGQTIAVRRIVRE